ncbi:MAG: hypothetical protein WB952_11885 [Terriglobales bacterium]
MTIAHSEEVNLEDLATLQAAAKTFGDLFSPITPERMREHLEELAPASDHTTGISLGGPRDRY